MTQRPSRWRPPRTQPREMSRRVLTWWLGLMGLAGLAFGLHAASRPFGDGPLAHPLVVFGVLAGAALLALRMIVRKPVPDIIPERILLAGFALGIALFVVGNFLATHLL